MNRGHFGTREFLVIALLAVGIAAAVLLLMNTPGSAPEAEAVPAPPKAPLAALPEPPAAEAPGEETPPEPEPPAKALDKTSGELVNESYSRAESRFYAKALSGEFDVKSFSWSRAPFNETPESVPLKENDLSSSSVRFDGRYIDSLRVFAFKVYIPKGESGPQSIFGSMALISPSSMDGLSADGSLFEIRFDPHPEGSQQMEQCKILSSSPYLSVSGTDIFVYDFECKVMYGASS